MRKTRTPKGKTLLMTVLASAGLAGFLVPSAALAADVERDSVDCKKPENNKVNYSWSKGITSVTVYYNNHCSHDVKSTLTIEDTYSGAYREECMTTQAGEKGRKKFDMKAVDKLVNIKSGCD